MKSACAYIRVSTDMQTELSPDAQKRLILDFCKKNDIIITDNDFFVDLGISGTKSDKRIEFNRMIATCKSKEHPYDCIIVWKFSRFARNQEESIVYKRMLRKENVEVLSVSEPIPEGMMGELIERILEWMDEYYSINLSQEVTRGMTEKAMRGGYLGSQPYGYTKAKDEDDKIPKVIESERQVIEYCFNKVANEDLSTSILAKRLNEKGFKTRGGKSWSSDTIEYMLRNPFYTGKIRWNYCKHDNARTINPKEEWIISESQHEGIVSEEIFNIVQSKLDARRKPTQRRGKIPRRHWLSGILKCESCGASINWHTGNPNRNISPFFQCRKYFNASCKCSQYTTVPKMEEYFFEALEQCLISGEFVYSKSESNSSNELSSISILKEQLGNINSKENRIKQAYRDGIDTLEEYKENKRIIIEEKEKILSLLENEEKNNIEKPKVNHKKQIEILIEYLQDDSFTIEEKYNAISKVIEKIVFSREKQTFDIYFYD